ncbi:ABC transporter ATP-binding protein [Sebaldella sp. S0638]|uniref:ATP-binding cassette domain-containing protein n=1 Tax=Sebaldella sp. S0638 TaxID=2957809 RepID=UPI00209E6B36|nr:ABC transporter ATP-binding protein [Sebaldella sp. S0638]MCP1223631.1 ABC transporter ATP-binding protein [Sebaldella sp. S0638]
MSIIKFEGVYKSYDSNEVLRNINLTVSKGEFITILGKSGGGKSTLLRLVNFLEKKNSGNLEVFNKEIETWNEIELRRKIGYVIQNTELFPHMTIEKNVGYTMELKNKSKIEIKKRTEKLLRMMKLPEDYLGKYPGELSGGEQQRVGVARALADSPEIILMDEPFGALDEVTRRNLQDEIKKIQRELGVTIILVTHDIDEAFKLGDRIVLMNNGEIDQLGTKEDFFSGINSDFGKDFFGNKLKVM